ncbi:Cell division cycle and apoptosis regulator protein 1 [Schistosoma japonicum]|nr:Cell division cycle and apoptosis regulator protein 1 [Schistosoma japonicum]
MFVAGTGSMMTAEASSHQLVGYVTKMYPTFGYINNEIFFQRKCVIGPMVEVGDNVAASAVYQPHMPIKWSAEKVWRVEERRGKSREKADESNYWKSQSPHKHSPRDSYSKPTSRERDTHPTNADQRRADKKRCQAQNRDEDRSIKKSPVRERRRSPLDLASTRHSSPTSGLYCRTPINPKRMLNMKEYLFSDLQRRFPNVLPPVDLYRVRCNWQESFPLLQPFHPHYTTTFQIIKDPENTCEETLQSYSSDSGFAAYVLLLSLPAMAELMEKIVVRAESPSRVRGSLRKYIKILAVGKVDERLKAIGGSWNPDLDGSDPATNPQTLINTAIRNCKQLIGLDLSHRFLEFRYSRTEGSTAQPTSVLFPGSQLWGRPATESNDVIPPSKPFHQIVVYFIPNVWSLMPADEEWSTIKLAYENVLASKEPNVFPLAPSSLKKFSGLESASKETSDGKLKLVVEMDSNSLKSPAQDNLCEDPNASKMDEGNKSILQAPVEHDGSALSTADQESVSKIANTPEAEDGFESMGPKNISIQGNPNQEGTEKCQKKLHTEINLANMKVSELREQLKARNLPTEGVRAQLLTRLKMAIQEEEQKESAIKAEKEKMEQAKALQLVTIDKSPQVPEEQVKPVNAESGSKPKTDVPKLALRDLPSIIILRKKNADFTVQSVGLDVVMDSKSDFMDSRSYEFMFCIHTIFDMLRRDSVFTLFRALVTAADRGICAKPRKRSEPDYAAKRARLERGERTSVAKDEEFKEIPLFTTDLSLLFACTILDTSYKSYFLSSEVEDFILSLGLPISRYQLRSLIYKVLDHGRFHYRSLTDSEEPLSLANKSSVIFSDIDDDEYLLELVRGGDAILDDQIDFQPSGSIIVLQKSDESVNSQATHPEEYFHHIRTSEREQCKLMTQIRLQEQEIARLRASVADFTELRDRLSRTASTMEDYRRRYRDERDKVDSLARVLEQQASVLDACRSALRQASCRFHNRHSVNDSSKQSKRSLSPCSVTSNKDSVKSTKKIKTSDSSKVDPPLLDSLNEESVSNVADSEFRTAENTCEQAALISGVHSDVLGNLTNGFKTDGVWVGCNDDENATKAVDQKCSAVPTEPHINLSMLLFVFHFLDLNCVHTVY